MAGRCWITNCKICGRKRSWRIWRSSRYIPDGNQKIHAITQDSLSPHWGSNPNLLNMKQVSAPLNLEIFYGRYWTFLLFWQHRFYFVLSTRLLWTVLYAYSSRSFSCSLRTIRDLEQKKQRNFKQISHYMWWEYFIIALQLPPLRQRYHTRWYTGNASDLHS